MKALQKRFKRWLALPHTTQNQPQCVNKHQRALWVGNVLPKPMALFNLIPLPVTTVSPPQTPWQPHLHISAYLPFPFKSLSDWLLSWQRLCLHKQSLPASSYTVNTENVPSISITLKPLYYRPLKINLPCRFWCILRTGGFFHSSKNNLFFPVTWSSGFITVTFIITAPETILMQIKGQARFNSWLYLIQVLTISILHWCFGWLIV